jgi:hypothetical protein
VLTLNWRYWLALLAAFALFAISSVSVFADESFDTDGFAKLADVLPERVGTPLTREFGTDIGTMQLTSTGAVYWHSDTGTIAFTDGYAHAALVGNRIVEWQGENAEPPVTFVAPVVNSRVYCIEMKESGGANVANRSGSGASGVMQYLPGTFYAHAAEMGHFDWSPWVPWQAESVAAHDLALGRRAQWTVSGC